MSFKLEWDWDTLWVIDTWSTYLIRYIGGREIGMLTTFTVGPITLWVERW